MAEIQKIIVEEEEYEEVDIENLSDGEAPIIPISLVEILPDPPEVEEALPTLVPIKEETPSPPVDMKQEPQEEESEKEEEDQIVKLLAEREYWAIIERKNYFFLQERREQEAALKLVSGTRRTAEQIKRDKELDRIIVCNLFEPLSPEMEEIFTSIPDQKNESGQRNVLETPSFRVIKEVEERDGYADSITEEFHRSYKKRRIECTSWTEPELTFLSAQKKPQYSQLLHAYNPLGGTVIPGLNGKNICEDGNVASTPITPTSDEKIIRRKSSDSARKSLRRSSRGIENEVKSNPLLASPTSFLHHTILQSQKNAENEESEPLTPQGDITIEPVSENPCPNSKTPRRERQTWTPAEKTLIKEMISAFGRDWKKISDVLQDLKNPTQIRNFYFNYRSKVFGEDDNSTKSQTPSPSPSTNNVKRRGRPCTKPIQAPQSASSSIPLQSPHTPIPALRLKRVTAPRTTRPTTAKKSPNENSLNFLPGEPLFIFLKDDSSPDPLLVEGAHIEAIYLSRDPLAPGHRYTSISPSSTYLCVGVTSRGQLWVPIECAKKKVGVGVKIFEFDAGASTPVLLEGSGQDSDLEDSMDFSPMVSVGENGSHSHHPHPSPPSTPISLRHTCTSLPLTPTLPPSPSHVISNSTSVSTNSPYHIDHTNTNTTSNTSSIISSHTLYPLTVAIDEKELMAARENMNCPIIKPLLELIKCDAKIWGEWGREKNNNNNKGVVAVEKKGEMKLKFVYNQKGEKENKEKSENTEKNVFLGANPPEIPATWSPILQAVDRLVSSYLGLAPHHHHSNNNNNNTNHHPSRIDLFPTPHPHHPHHNHNINHIHNNHHNPHNTNLHQLPRSNSSLSLSQCESGSESSVSSPPLSSPVIAPPAPLFHPDSHHLITTTTSMENMHSSHSSGNNSNNGQGIGNGNMGIGSSSQYTSSNNNNSNSSHNSNMGCKWGVGKQNESKLIHLRKEVARMSVLLWQQACEDVVKSGMEKEEEPEKWVEKIFEEKKKIFKWGASLLQAFQHYLCDPNIGIHHPVEKTC